MLTSIMLPILLLSASYTDIKERIIPNTICWLICLCALPDITLYQALGATLMLPLLVIGALSDGIGGGDIKLIGAMGFALGYPDILMTLVAGLSVMLMYHAVLTFIRKRNHEAVCCTYPMAPFLGVGYCIMLLLRIV